jgi:ParB family chromosome partitioning protein
MEDNMENENDKEEIAQVVEISIEKLHSFANHPYKVQNDSKMQLLIDSVAKNGILTPLLVRARIDGDYEIISGHRRKAAATNVGLKQIPAIIQNLDDPNAVIVMVESNHQREEVLPSERATAYKMEMDAIKALRKQNKVLSQVETKPRSDQLLAMASKESRATIQRYIRLTYLCEDLLRLVDEGQIAVSPAVEISYLPMELQTSLMDAMVMHQATPSLSQAITMHNMVKEKKLTKQEIYQIMGVRKANQKERLSLPADRVALYFPSNILPQEISEIIMRILEKHKNELPDYYPKR